MVQEYRVVKPFGVAKEGDIFTYNEEYNNYEMNIETIEEENGFSYSSRRVMSIDLNTVNIYEQAGLITSNDNKDSYCDEDDYDKYDKECNITYYEKLQKIQETIDGLKIAYIDNNKQIDEAYANKEIPACVKVEANTVHYNLMKLIGKIQEIIDEK